jgi:cytochrome c biogenesis protein CcmG, thiol:disulfide interchange protein DsbE
MGLLETQMRKLPLIAVLLLAAGAIVTVAINSSTELSRAEQTGNDAAAQQLAGTVTITGEPLPDLTQTGADPAIGLPAPQIVGAGFDGTPVQLGRPNQAITFMASWCPACQAELPTVVELAARNMIPAGVELVIVATLHDDTRDNWPPDRWLSETGWNGPVLADDTGATAAAAYGLTATPTWVLIGSDGTVTHRHAGVVTPDTLVALLTTIAP